MMDMIKSKASSSRSEIFKALLSLPHDDKFLGYLVTQKAKELGLVSSDRKNLKGNTINEWSNSMITDGRNAPNAWACTAAARILLDYGRKIDLGEDAIIALSYYLNPTDVDDVYFQSKTAIVEKLIDRN
jgi:hypothetical protein